jgi:two-component system LytT family response regulator
VHTKSDGEILVSKPMKFFLDILGNLPEFYKPHRSYLINLKYIKQYVSKDGGYIVMENDKNVSLSKEKKEAFFEAIKGI